MRQFLEKNVAVIENKYEKVSSNLNQCRKSLKALEGVLKRIATLGEEGDSGKSLSTPTSSNKAAQRDDEGNGSGNIEEEGLTRSRDDEFLENLNIKVRLPHRVPYWLLSPLTLSLPLTYTFAAQYDHSQCSDCSCVYTMSNECLMSLASAQFVAEEATRR